MKLLRTPEKSMCQAEIKPLLMWSMLKAYTVFPFKHTIVTRDPIIRNMIDFQWCKYQNARRYAFMD